ncbi:MAG: hypothetical protein QGD90_12520 [Candidatus Hydrogenedentes bacterium]|nr:hypothetical protein [Candidatus Hydrogenedentota bacterium]
MKIRAFLILIVLSVAVLACQQPAEDTEEAVVGPDSSQLGVEAAEVEQSPHYEKQILSTAELMKQLMDPIYEDLKDAIEVPPKGRKAWRALYIASYNLAEVNNLLFSREPEDDEDEEKKAYLYTQEWIDESLEAVDLLVKLAESVRAQSEYDVMKANYMAVLNNCNQCHRVFELEKGEIDEILAPDSWGLEVEEDPEVFHFL